MPTPTPGLPALPDRAALDEMHERLQQLSAQCLAAAPAEFAERYHALVAMIEADFRQEEALMDSFECPDALLHREQHARMLAGLHHAEAELDENRTEAARRALECLEEWLPVHMATQDRHLVRALDRHQAG